MVTQFEKTWAPKVWTERAGWAIREVSPVALGRPSQFLQRRDIPLVVAPVRVPGPRQPEWVRREALLHPWNAAFQPDETRRMICCHQGIKNIMIRCYEDYGHPR